jgi:hypothetical protein
MAAEYWLKQVQDDESVRLVEQMDDVEDYRQTLSNIYESQSWSSFGS